MKNDTEKCIEMEELELAKREYADKHSFRVPYNGTNDFYDKVDLRASEDGFEAGFKFAQQGIPIEKGLNKISRKLHESAMRKGFWEQKRETGTLLMLVVSELAEALEADRKNKFADLRTLENCINADDINEDDKAAYFISEFQRNIKDTFEDEIADTFIRLFDLVGAMNIDIEKHIELKMRYNQSREYMHGKKY